MPLKVKVKTGGESPAAVPHGWTPAGRDGGDATGETHFQPASPHPETEGSLVGVHAHFIKKMH